MTNDRKSWDWPDCPGCGSDLFVQGHPGTGDPYQCHRCSDTFDPEVAHV